MWVLIDMFSGVSILYFMFALVIALAIAMTISKFIINKKTKPIQPFLNLSRLC